MSNNKSKFFMGLTKSQIIDRLTAQDVRTVFRTTDDGDYQFINDIIQGNGFVQYGRMTDDDLMGEYHDRADEIEQLIDDGELPWLED